MRFHLLHSEATEGMVAKFYYPKSQRYDVYVDGTFVEANNGEWNDDNTKYNLKPRDDKYIPSHTGSFVAGENYFDPVEKFLYVVVTGQKAIEIKMKPVVVFKFGGSVPIDEVFNEDTIVSNIANILGIDPSLIRVSEIVKEGSRSLASDRNEPATKQVEYQVEISQPPAAETQSVTNADAASEEYQESVNVVSSAESTLVNQQQEGKLDLKAVVSPSFEASSFEQVVSAEPARQASDVVVTQDTPQETSGKLISDVIQEQEAEDQARLTEVKSIGKASSIAVDYTNFGSKAVKEMVKLPFAIKAVVLDDAGRSLSEVGTELKRWEVTVSCKTVGTKVLGTLTVAFDAQGLATFDNLMIDKAGENIELQFRMTYPDDSTLETTMTLAETVESRPLSIKFEDVPKAQKKNATFTSAVVAVLWDDALDEAADASLVPAAGISCTISLKAGGDSLSGTLTKDMDTSTAKVTFDDLKVEDVSDNTQFVLVCQDKSESSRMLESRSLDSSGVESPSVVIHDWPELSMQRRSTLGLSYEGPRDLVNPTINAFNNLMVEGSEINVEQLPTDNTGEEMVIDKETLDLFVAQQLSHPYCFAGTTCQL